MGNRQAVETEDALFRVACDISRNEAKRAAEHADAERSAAAAKRDLIGTATFTIEGDTWHVDHDMLEEPGADPRSARCFEFQLAHYMIEYRNVSVTVWCEPHLPFHVGGWEFHWDPRSADPSRRLTIVIEEDRSDKTVYIRAHTKDRYETMHFDGDTGRIIK